MTEQHPTSMPLELFQTLFYDSSLTWAERIHAAYAIGADQELEACCEWLKDNIRDQMAIEFLRDARRPSPPPSLKEQALSDLDKISNHYIGPGTSKRIENIRHALEALPDA